MFDEPGFERPAEPDDADLPLIYDLVYCSRADAGVDEAEVDRIVASSRRYNPARRMVDLGFNRNRPAKRRTPQGF